MNFEDITNEDYIDEKLEVVPNDILEAMLETAQINKDKGMSVDVNEEERTITVTEGEESYVIETSEAKTILNEVPSNIQASDFILALL